MITSVHLENFGPLVDLNWQGLGPINLVLGCNGAGKTFLLKALYSVARTLEEYKRGDDRRTAAEVLFNKLYWTFQQDKLGDLVTKGANKPLSCCVSFEGREFRYHFGKSTTKQITSIENHVAPRTENTVFLPAKEVLSFHQVILTSRDRDKIFGFDDTYYDLARMLLQPPTRGRNYDAFAKSRQQLEDMFDGKVIYDPASNEWQFKKANQKFQMGVTAEGIKKVAILDTLLGNRTLTPGSVVFFDEPEAALHPTAISALLDIMSVLAEAGIQFFLASHSYFVVKSLYLIAQKKQMSVPVLSMTSEGPLLTNLKDGMPSNPIIAESIRLHAQEVEMALR